MLLRMNSFVSVFLDRLSAFISIVSIIVLLILYRYSILGITTWSSISALISQSSTFVG
jgi:hypothetical protein